MVEERGRVTVANVTCTRDPGVSADATILKTMHTHTEKGGDSKHNYYCKSHMSYIHLSSSEAPRELKVEEHEKLSPTPRISSIVEIEHVTWDFPTQ